MMMVIMMGISKPYQPIIDSILNYYDNNLDLDSRWGHCDEILDQILAERLGLVDEDFLDYDGLNKYIYSGGDLDEF